MVYHAGIFIFNKNIRKSYDQAVLLLRSGGVIVRTMVLARHYCFTSYDDDAPTRGTGVRYMIYQWEKCPSTGRMHWQGYVEFYDPIRRKAAMAACGVVKGRFFERKGTRDEARDYCLKSETREEGPFEEGEWIKSGKKGSAQGSRTDVKEVAKMIKDHADEKQVAEKYPVTYMRMYRGIRELRNKLQGKRNWKTHVEIYWGPTGTGKSLLASELLPNAFIMSNEKGWWDGYDGEADVIIDDFRPTWWGIGFMLNLLDRRAMRVEVKGSSVEFLARNIIITSNVDPKNWYAADWPAIQRRVDHIENLV